MSGEGTGPRQRIQREPLNLPLIRGGQRLERPRLSVTHSRYAAGGRVGRPLGQQRGAQASVVPALSQRELELTVGLVQASGPLPLAQQQPGPSPRRAGGQPLELLGQQVQQTPQLARFIQTPGEREHPIASPRRAHRGPAQRMRSQVDRLLASASSRRLARGGGQS